MEFGMMHFPLRAPSPPQLRPKGMHYMPTRIPAYRKGPEVAEVPNSFEYLFDGLVVYQSIR